MKVALSTPLPVSCFVTSPSPSFLFSKSIPYPKFSFSTRKPFPSRTRSLVAQIVEGETSEENAKKSLARRLILLRHANSSWADPSLRDHDRPLSKVGRADAINVSRKLQQMGWIPELILSSDAARTRETLKIMQEQVRGFLDAEVYFIPSFYSVAAMDGQTAEHLQQAICEYSRDEDLTVMCMGHNRGWEEAASMFSGSSVELKTCNAALLEAAGKSWEEWQFLFQMQGTEKTTGLFLHCVFYVLKSQLFSSTVVLWLAGEAFTLAGLGGWKLHGIVKPNTSWQEIL